VRTAPLVEFDSTGGKADGVFPGYHPERRAPGLARAGVLHAARPLVAEYEDQVAGRERDVLRLHLEESTATQARKGHAAANTGRRAKRGDIGEP
jgi:hypothetical protein